MALVSIEVDGKTIYEGDCIDGMYVRRLAGDIAFSAQPEALVRGKLSVVDPVIVDYLENGMVRGVEILAPIDPRVEEDYDAPHDGDREAGGTAHP